MIESVRYALRVTSDGTSTLVSRLCSCEIAVDRGHSSKRHHAAVLGAEGVVPNERRHSDGDRSCSMVA